MSTRPHNITYTILDGTNEYGDSLVCNLDTGKNVQVAYKAAYKAIFRFFYDDSDFEDSEDAIQEETKFCASLQDEGYGEIDFGQRVIKKINITEIQPIQIIAHYGRTQCFKNLPTGIRVEYLDYGSCRTPTLKFTSDDYPAINDENIVLCRILQDNADWETMTGGTRIGWFFDRECTKPIDPIFCDKVFDCEFNLNGEWSNEPPKSYPCLVHTSWIKVI